MWLRAGCPVAVAGQLDEATAKVAVVTGVEPAARAAHYLAGRNGMVLSLNEISRPLQDQIATGETRVLSEQEIRNYLSTGSIDG